jgi:hypothetical protein
MAILGTTRLKVANGSASVTKLWNGRYRLEFLCDPSSDKTDWYYENIGGILPEFAASQDAFFGKGVDESWQAIPESVYPNMVCVEASYPYIPSIGEKRVSLAYETLTSSWVQEKDEDTDYELNGLKRVSRVSVALPETAYTNVVGTTTIDSDGTTLYLGTYQIDETDAKWTLSEIWLEAGTLNVSTTTEATGLNRVATTFLHIEGATSGPVVSRSEQNVEGLKTITVTTLQRSDGGDLTDGDPTNTFGAMFNFSYPGVVGVSRVTTASLGGDIAINRFFYQSPPVQRPIPATSYVFFQTSGLPASEDYVYDGAIGLWSPSEWAGGTYYGWRYQRDNFGTPIGERPGFRGFRAVENDDDEIPNVYTSLTGMATDDDGLSGTLLLNGTTYEISVSGGPEKPDGNKYTLGTIDIEPAFVDEDGVQYYKKVITVATIPAQGSSVIT